MAKSTRKTSPKTVKPADGTQVNMTTAMSGMDLGTDDDVLAALLGDAAGKVDTEEGNPLADTTASGIVGEPELEAALSDSTVTAGADEAGAKAAAKPAKKAKAPKAPAEPKPAAAPRITYVGHTKSEVLKARLGDKASELLLLEVADATLPAEELQAKQEALLDDIDKLAKKVGEKANMLFAWLKNGGKLNEVMQRSLQVLAKEGELTSGDKGNLQSNLRDKYSVGTARSQANQMFMLFPALAITVKEKGRMVANPNSLILMKAKAELSL